MIFIPNSRELLTVSHPHIYYSVLLDHLYAYQSFKGKRFYKDEIGMSFDSYLIIEFLSEHRDTDFIFPDEIGLY